MGGSKGGSTTLTTQQFDNRSSGRLADIATKQYEMGAEQWEMYKEYFMPYEIAAAEANQELLPLITEASKTTLGLQKGATEEFYRQATEGVNVGERMDQAGAEVVSAMKLGEQTRRRESSRIGIDPGSDTYKNLGNQQAIATATGVAGARTRAKRLGEAESFNRLGSALGGGVMKDQVGPNVDPYGRAQGSMAGAAQSYASLANRVLRGRGRGSESQTAIGATGSAVAGIVQGASAVSGAYYGSQ